MKAAALVLVWAAASCAAPPPAEDPQPLASVAAPNTLTNPPAVTTQGTASEGAPARTLRATQPLQVDRSKGIEIRDVYVDLKEPNGMRALVPYLLHTEEWTLLKVEDTSPTTRHYRFQRMASKGEEIPMPDPLQPRNKRTLR